MLDPKYPHIHVQLTGHDGNAFAIIGRVLAALKRAGVHREERDRYIAESTEADYDHLLRTAMRWVDVS